MPSKAAQTQSHQISPRMRANAIRALSMDAVEQANSGHPGMPMGCADIAEVLYRNHLKFDPSRPDWFDRDRFILSAGHGSMLLYALNYLTGYEKMTLDEIRNFRQLHALTAGHPEVDVAAGIETTTGPLGQGIATSVGFALAERIMNASYGDDLVDHYTYVIASDGDLMEGISHEACSLAGHLKLSKLIVLYDDNGISIDGSTDLTFIDDTPKRFAAYGWDVQSIDGHNSDEIDAAITKAKSTNTPSLICCKTKIGFGAPTKENTSGSHGAPLGGSELAGAKRNLDWDHGPFEIPDDILNSWREIGAQGVPLRESWEKRIHAHKDKATFEAHLKGDFKDTLASVTAKLKDHFATNKPGDATRKTSGACLEALIPEIPGLIGGSADLTGSNNTKSKENSPVIYSESEYKGQYINYGVREHGMAAAMNGMRLHGGITPYAGTFLQFADYARPAIRLGALMRVQSIHVMTHDSIGLGEDGPTHQPVEHLAALRAIPNTYVFRPCDGVETAECWEAALNKTDAPSILALTRQGVPTLRSNSPDNKSSKGAYILRESGGEPDVTLFASGSEVSIASDAYERLISDGKKVRLVSVPCLDLFFEQEDEYIASITCNASVKVAIEAAIRQPWNSLIGPHGAFVGMESFGESAPAKDLYQYFGITADAVIEKVNAKLEKRNNS